MPGSSRGRLGVAAALAALLALGWWLRVQHLGRLGLVADEGNQVLAVQGILEHGVPKVDSGRLYIRGIPYLYAEAAMARRFGLDEFSMRLPSVLFGLFGVLTAFALANALFGWRVALLTAVCMTVSVWEIQFSRYARFYAAFQALFALSLLGFYQVGVQGKLRALWWLVPCVAAAISMHELSVLLAPCALIPLAVATLPRRRKIASLAMAGGVGLMWLAYPTLLSPLKAMGGLQPPPMPSSSVSRGWFEDLLGAVIGGVKARFYLPPLEPAQAAWREDPGIVLALVFVVLAASVYCVWQARRGEGWRALAALPLLWAAAAYQVSLALVWWIAYAILWARSRRDLATPAFRAAYLAAIVALAVWSPWLTAADHPDRVLFQFPDVWRYFLTWFVRGWPIMTWVAFAGWLLLIRRYLRSRRRDAAAIFLVAATWVPVVIASFLQNEFYAARYTYHVYPMVLMAVSFVVLAAAERWVGPLTAHAGLRHALGLLVIASALVLAQDTNPAMARRVGDQTHRTRLDPVRSLQNWGLYAEFHQDLRTPARYVRAHRRPGDRVVVFGPAYKLAIAHFYADGVDYSVEERPKNYQKRRVDGTIRDHVTGSLVLEGLQALRSVVAEAPGTVWLIFDKPHLAPTNRLYSEPMKAYLTQWLPRAVFVGEDAQTVVVQLDASDA